MKEYSKEAIEVRLAMAEIKAVGYFDLFEGMEQEGFILIFPSEGGFKVMGKEYLTIEEALVAARRHSGIKSLGEKAATVGLKTALLAVEGGAKVAGAVPIGVAWFANRLRKRL